MYLTYHLMRKKFIPNPWVTFDNLRAKVDPLPVSASMTHSDQMNLIGHLLTKDVIRIKKSQKYDGSIKRRLITDPLPPISLIPKPPVPTLPLPIVPTFTMDSTVWFFDGEFCTNQKITPEELEQAILKQKSINELIVSLSDALSTSEKRKDLVELLSNLISISNVLSSCVRIFIPAFCTHLVYCTVDPSNLIQFFGSEVGSNIGLEVGSNVVPAVGLNVGVDFGSKVGLEVGSNVGPTVGSNVGPDVFPDVIQTLVHRLVHTFVQTMVQTLAQTLFQVLVQRLVQRLV